MEWNDIYDKDRRLTGRKHRRNDSWKPGEYGLVVCVWVYDGRGNLLLTRRAPGKSFAGTWENSGGAALAGETSRQAIARELREETGIARKEEEFEFLSTSRNDHFFFDHYCIRAEIPLEQIRLLPGETDDAQWVDFETVHQMIESGQICRIIAKQFLAEESALRMRQTAQEK